MMPQTSQSINQHLAECASSGGEGLPRASFEEIRVLVAKGYEVRDCGIFHPDLVGMFQWLHTDGAFQEDIESYSEDDSWALAKKWEADSL